MATEADRPEVESQFESLVTPRGRTDAVDTFCGGSNLPSADSGGVRCFVRNEARALMILRWLSAAD